MTRHTLVWLLALPLLAVLSLAVWPPPAARAASKSDFQLDVQISQDRLRRVQCDGDSVPIAVRITRVADGSPVVGAAVKIGGDDATSARQMVTGRRGIARSEVEPKVQPLGGFPRRSYYVNAIVEGVELLYGPRFYACPYPEGEFGLTAHLFVDKNGNGVVDKHEPDFGRRDALLSFGANTRQSSFGSRAYAIDRHGTFSTTLFTGGYGERNGVLLGAWRICLTDRQVERRWQIVSLNGAALPEVSACVTLPQLAPGENEVSIGVARIGAHPEE